MITRPSCYYVTLTTALMSARRRLARHIAPPSGTTNHSANWNGGTKLYPPAPPKPLKDLRFSSHDKSRSEHIKKPMTYDRVPCRFRHISRCSHTTRSVSSVHAWNLKQALVCYTLAGGHVIAHGQASTLNHNNSACRADLQRQTMEAQV